MGKWNQVEEDGKDEQWEKENKVDWCECVGEELQAGRCFLKWEHSIFIPLGFKLSKQNIRCWSSNWCLSSMSFQLTLTVCNVGGPGIGEELNS